METLNRILFLWINAPEHPGRPALTLATLLAEQLIWAVPLLIGMGWLRGGERTRMAMLAATAAGLLGLLVNQFIGLLWTHPRPFMIDLGHTLIPHVADSSFPSDHLTLWWAVAFSLLTEQGTRRLGAALAVLGFPIAWARIYLGVHFPLDMLGAAAVAALSAWTVLHMGRRCLQWVYGLATRVHRILFGRLIEWGWVRE